MAEEKRFVLHGHAHTKMCYRLLNGIGETETYLAKLMESRREMELLLGDCREVVDLFILDLVPMKKFDRVFFHLALGRRTGAVCRQMIERCDKLPKKLRVRQKRYVESCHEKLSLAETLGHAAYMRFSVQDWRFIITKWWPEFFPFINHYLVMVSTQYQWRGTGYYEEDFLHCLTRFGR